MSRKLWYASLVLMAGTSYGFVSTVMKLSYRAGYSAIDSTNAQYFFSALLLWLIAIGSAMVRRRRDGLQWGLLTLLGVSGAVTSVCYYLALTNLPASLGIVLLFQFSWMVTVLDVLIAKRRPEMDKVIGLLCIFVGTFFAVGLRRDAFVGVAVWALVLGLLAGFSYAVTLYFSAHVTPAGSPSLRSAIVATISFLFIVIPFRPSFLWNGTLLHGLWFYGLVGALFSQVIPLILLLTATPHIGGRMAGVLGSVELPVAVLVANVMLSERVTSVQWLGNALIVFGIVASELDLFSRLLGRRAVPDEA